MALLAPGCEQPSLQAPPFRDVRGPTLRIVPAPGRLAAGETLRFLADVRDPHGVPLVGAVVWQAEGGTIDDHGLFVAGSRAGEFRVLAQGTVGGLGLVSSTAGRITLAGGDSTPGTTPPPPASTSPWPQSPGRTLTISPVAERLAVGVSGRFTAVLLDAAGLPVPGPVLWQATGGTIDPQGTYVALGPPGEHHVVARSGGLHVRARVVVDGPGGSAARPDPPPAPAGAIQVPAGSGLRSLVEASPPGTTFVLHPGFHQD